MHASCPARLSSIGTSQGPFGACIDSLSVTISLAIDSEVHKLGTWVLACPGVRECLCEQSNLDCIRSQHTEPTHVASVALA